jgi:hypothetical protein
VVTNARVTYTPRAAAGALAPGIPHALTGELYWTTRALCVAADADAWINGPVNGPLLGDDAGTNLPAAISTVSVQNIFMRARADYAAGNIARAAAVAGPVNR